MALLNAVVLTSKTIKGGKNKVRISVAHNGETRYIVTDIILDSNREFKNGVVVKRPDAAMLNTKIRNLLQRYQSALDELEYISGLSCPELVFQLRHTGQNKHRTLQSIFEEYMDRANVKPRTKENYQYFWRIISRYIGGRLLVEHLTHSTVLAFDKQLRLMRLKAGTIRCIVGFLMTVVNFAQHCGYVQFRVDPFWGYVMPHQEVCQSWLSVGEIRKIRDAEITKKNVRKCRDLFMLSYYLGGINMNDLVHINFNENVDVIRYIRKKTENRPKANKYVEFSIPEEAKQIIKRYKNKSGYVIHSDSQRKFNCAEFLNYNMPKVAEKAGLKHLIFYSARKSFAQHAFDIGVRESVIDYILGHKVGQNKTCLFAYIYVTPEKATEAIRKVLDNLK